MLLLRKRGDASRRYLTLLQRKRGDTSRRYLMGWRTNLEVKIDSQAMANPTERELYYPSPSIASRAKGISGRVIGMRLGRFAAAVTCFFFVAISSLYFYG